MLSSKLIKNGLLRVLNDLVLHEEKTEARRKEGRQEGGDEEEGGTRRKDGQGGRTDGEEGGTGRMEGRGRKDEKAVKMKNERVAKGRIIGLAGPCFLATKSECELRELFSGNHVSV